MAIKLKAKETLLHIGEYSGQYRYILSTELYSKLSESKVIQEAALRSGVSRGIMQTCWDAAGEVIKAWATEGHSVAIPGLGTMRFGVRAKSVESVDKVASSLITMRRVIFTPSIDIKNDLKNTAINITCYDKDGNQIKSVVSDDSGDVENDDDNSGNGGNNGGGNASSNNVTITLNAGAGGKVQIGSETASTNVSKSVAPGTQLTIKAIANPGYGFDKWSDNQGGATRTITVNSDITLTASFISGEDE